MIRSKGCRRERGKFEAREAQRAGFEHGSAPRGFTIVEVIVVIGIVAVLIGLLAPTLANVATAGRGTLCQSNLRQMAIAAEAYAGVHRRYPVALRYDNRQGPFKIVSWDWVKTFDGQLLQPGPLWSFTNDPERVMQCPEYFGPSNAPGDPFTGYNYSTYIGGEEPFSSSPAWNKIRDGARPGTVRRPGDVAMFGCGGYAGGANKYMRSPLHSQHSDMNLALSTIYSGGQAFRYRGTTYVAYVDGHVAAVTQPRKGELATDELLYHHLGFSSNGFLSDDASAYQP